MEAEVKDVVITVPAYFGMAQKEATKEAGEIAGLNVLMIINEPTAAALAYGINTLRKDQTVFVFDLGRRTFDVTILAIRGNEIHMLTSDGDSELGGQNWDDLLTSHCSCLFKEKYGNDPQYDPNSYQELYDRVVKAKISLSIKPKALICVNHAGKRENVEMTREKFEELSKDLLAQCKSISERVLEKTEMTWNDIDTVLLVGGSTYMPMVRTMIKEISGKETSTIVNPDQCIAIGAAYQGHNITTDWDFSFSILPKTTYQGHDITLPRWCKGCEEYFENLKKQDHRVSQFDNLAKKPFYEILGVSEDADYTQIKKIYDDEYKKYINTRDKAKANARWIPVCEAWECLRDPNKRKKYDSRSKKT